MEEPPPKSWMCCKSPRAHRLTLPAIATFSFGNGAGGSVGEGGPSGFGFRVGCAGTWGSTSQASAGWRPLRSCHDGPSFWWVPPRNPKQRIWSGSSLSHQKKPQISVHVSTYVRFHCGATKVFFDHHHPSKQSERHQ